MTDELSVPFTSTFASMNAAARTVSEWLSEHQVPEAVTYFGVFAVEELATNCIKYAYDDTSEHPLEVKLSLSDHELELTFVDDGRPFNPLLASDPELARPVHERPIGGLGLYLLRQMSERAEYRRQGRENRVTFRKSLTVAE